MNALKIDDSILQYKQFHTRKRGAREIPSFAFKQIHCERSFRRSAVRFHIKSNWNVFYDDDFVIQIIKILK